MENFITVSKISLKMLWSFACKVFVGGFFIILLDMTHTMLVNYELPFEWFIKVLYWFIGLTVLYAIGDSMNKRNNW